MLETLVSSRIRRTLFEYLLTHPHERFYLRGLAKDLSLSVSPLRRELKRLERAGMLRTVQEANILFYTVNADSPAFLQLRQAGQQTPTPKPLVWGQTEAPSPAAVPAQVEFGVRSSPAPAIMSGGPGEFGVASESATQPGKTLKASWRSPLNSPALIGAAGMGMALLFIVAGLVYLTWTNQRLVSEASRSLATRKAEMTVAAPKPSASGTMSGNRWRVVPGGFGGFSSGTSSGSR